MGKKLKPSELRKMQAEEKNAKVAKIAKIAKRKKKHDKNAKKALPHAAKHAGIKSVFVADDRIIMTTFGRGNDAIIEKYIKNENIKDVQTPENYEANLDCEEENDFIRVEKGLCGNSANTANPIMNLREGHYVGEDVIGAKEALEKRYFGKTFNDNIHIQLIYNILDINKILAVFSNNIVYTINNLLRKDLGDNPDMTDFIGMGRIGLAYPYEVFSTFNEYAEDKKKRQLYLAYLEFENLCKNPRLAYFCDAFMHTEGINEKTKKPKYVNNDKAEIYNVLALLDELRMSCVHDDDKGVYNGHEKEGRAFIFNLDERLSKKDDVKEIIEKLYKNKIDSLKTFADNSSKMNFKLLFEAMGIDINNANIKNIVQDYYRFSVLKDYKNIGFSVKVLRECIIAKYHQELKEKKFDSQRAKLYSILDFLILKQYPEKSANQNELVKQLRSKEKNEEKDAIYKNEADKIWPRLKNGYDNCIKSLQDAIHNKEEMKKLALEGEEKQIVKEAIDEIKLGEEATLFSKFIYMLTLFIDGKEINDLLTTLINKFENIAAFETVMAKEKIEFGFTKDYKMFDYKNLMDSDSECKISRELRTINSIARMQSKETISAKRAMYEDAALMLGMENYDKDQLAEYIEKNFTNTEKMKTKLIKGENQPDKGFRNFIVSNLIESWRFRYIVRYVNPKTARAFMKNEAVVHYVFTQIAKNESESKTIDRYYNACQPETFSKNIDERIKYLEDVIKGVDADRFSDVDNSLNAEKSLEKQRYLAVLSLYLNILYQIVKNLVNINSRYVMAFQRVEHDGNLLCGHKIEHGSNNLRELSMTTIGDKREKYNDKVSKITKPMKYYKNLLHENRVITYCEQNIYNSDNVMITEFRNKVAHLNAVRDAHLYIKDITNVESYFALYHYLMQSCISAGYKFANDRGWIVENDGERYFKDKKGNVKEENRINPKSIQYLSLMEKNNTYCKDFVKALCVPFIYNLPRFKNLSIDGLFDKARPGEKKDCDIVLELN